MQISQISSIPCSADMRKALIIGIDYYHDFTSLSGCVNDADAVAGVLSRNADGASNFTTPKVLTATGAQNAITRKAFGTLSKHSSRMIRKSRFYTSQGMATSMKPEASCAQATARTVTTAWLSATS
jgi:hypothetical protein